MVLRRTPRAAVALLALLTLSSQLVTSAAQAASGGASKPGPSHWVERNGGLPSETLTAVAVDPDDDRVVYAGLDGFLFRSDDAGETFAPVLSFPRGVAEDPALSVTTDDTDGTSFDEAAAVGRASPDIVDDPLDDPAGEGPVDTLDNANGGNLDDDLPDGSLDASNRASGFGGGGIGADIGAANDDAGDFGDFAVATRLESGVRSIAFVPNTPGAFLVATPRGLYRTNNNALSFERLSVPGGLRENDIRDVVVDPARPSRVYVATASGLFLSKDGGASLERVNGRLGTTGVICLAVDGSGATGPLLVGDNAAVTSAVGTLLVGSERGLLRSRDGGDSFSELLLRGESAFPLIHAVAVAQGGTVLYAGVASGLYAAERNSAILEHYDGMPDDPPTSISPDPREAGGLVLATRNRDGGAFASTDIGLTTVAMEPLPAQQVFALAREGKNTARLWAATDRGLFRLEPGTGIRVSRDDLQGIRERFANEPPLIDLIARAQKHQRSDVDVASMMSRAGWAPLLPELNAGYQLDAGDTNQQRTQFVFVIGVGQPPTSDPESEFTDQFNNGLIVLQPTQQVQHRVWVNLTWDLDRVILSPGTTTLGRNASTNVQNQRNLADSVRSFYVMRRRLIAQVALEAKKATTAQKQLARIHKELEILEVEAHLAALVGEDLFDADTVPAASSRSSEPR